MRKPILLLSLLLLSFSSLLAQKGVGLKFSSDLSYFFRADEYDLVDGFFSSGIFGVFYRSYNEKGGYELGLNVNYKNSTGNGFPNLPIVMDDFGDDPEQNVGLTALEFDMKVGPRFGVVNPQIGYIFGYYLQTDGFVTPDSELEPNRFYFTLPFGCLVDLPTNFGTVGFGAFYEVGVTNVLKDPGTTSGGLYDGGRLRSINFEITVTYSVVE